tara:strand:- start:12339 stop:12536 length:198 start_codon:yes stop_codon:yes gene_type:complete
MPTYDKNRNPVRAKIRIVPDEEWRKETAEEFREKYGAWWIFVNVRGAKEGWIDQYKKKNTRSGEI